MKDNIIFVFPGQGVQNVGMGAEIWRDFASARYAYEMVSDILKTDIVKIMHHGSDTVLNAPENAAVAIFANSVAVASVIEDEIKKPLYDIAYAITGHSMGQYSALYCAGSLGLADAVGLLKKRSYYMYKKSPSDAGMVVVVGIDRDSLLNIINSILPKGFVQISNINADNQFVVSGYNNALEELTRILKARGVKLVRRMNVAYPAHCALMKDAEIELRADIRNVYIDKPKTKWFSNHVADIVDDPEKIRDMLCSQLTHGVRWAEIVKKFPEHNIKYAYELGAGRTLSGLINRANVGCVAKNTDKSVDLKFVLDDISRNLAKTR
jgi:[acyl-carrier-protein] S-malonyltransferase